MAWVKLDDQFFRHPKVLAAGLVASHFYLGGLAYAAQYLTDGFIAASALPSLIDLTTVPGSPTLDNLADALVRVNLWERTEGGFRIHDYLQYNPSRESALAKRRANAERVATWKALHTNSVSNALPSEHKKRTPDPERSRNAVSNALASENDASADTKARSGNAVTNAAPVPVPVPLRPSVSQGDTAAQKAQPHTFEDWLERADRETNKVGVLIDMVSAMRKRPLQDKPGSRAAGFLKTLNGDTAYAVKLLWEAIASNPAGDIFSFATSLRKAGGERATRKQPFGSHTAEDYWRAAGEAGQLDAADQREWDQLHPGRTSVSTGPGPVA